MRTLRFLLLAVTSCGSTVTVSDNPPEAETEVDQNACASLPTPQDIEVGDTFANACFEGYLQPAAATVSPICLCDFYNPSKTADEPCALLINGATLWSQPSKESHAKLPALYEDVRDRGVEILGVLIQAESPGGPADLDDLNAWMDAFAIPFPIAIDADNVFGGIVETSQYPFTLLIDTSTMAITEVAIGVPGEPFLDQAAALGCP